MLTIAGNGMGEYDFSNLTVDPGIFDRIVCDRNFKESGEKILKLGYREAKEYILSRHTEENILYVVTGSPLFYSAGALIAKNLPPSAFTIIDNTSSKSYLLSRLGIGENEVETVSLHGRGSVDLEAFFRKRYTFVLCDEKSVQRLRDLLRYLDAEDYRVIVGYKLGYADEVIEEIALQRVTFDLRQPYVLLIERCFDHSPLSEDSEFETERGMITKKLKRGVTLQSLDLMPNESLWDIGSGSGSCAIEAYKRYRVRTALFEKNPKRIGYIKRNLNRHKVIGCRLFEGRAEELFHKVEDDPDKIFVGGGGAEVIRRLPYLYERLKKGGRMLISAVTLRNLAQMIEVLDRAGLEYEVGSYAITAYKGDLKMIEPQRTLFNILIDKEGES